MVGGALAYIPNLLLPYVLTELAGMYYLVSFIITQVIVVIYGFAYNAKIIFSTTMTGFGFLKYLATVTLMSAFNIILVSIITEIAGIYYIFSIAIVLVVTLAFKYVLFWKFVFPANSMTSSSARDVVG